MYKDIKASQIAAYFLKMHGHQMAHLKLIKLMYLADRLSLTKTGYPLTYDVMMSLPHGPILSATLNRINGRVQARPDYWTNVVGHNGRNDAVLLVNEVDISALSDSDIEILNEVSQHYGVRDKFDLRDLTHNPKVIPEWRDPSGSSLPISYEDIFLATGRSSEEAKQMAEEVQSIEEMDRLFDSL